MADLADGSVSYDSQVDFQNKDTEKFIEEKFIQIKVKESMDSYINVLEDKIKDLVRKETNKQEYDFLENHCESCKSSNRCIAFLEKEVDFLRSEMLSKNKIIEMLLQDGRSSQTNLTKIHTGSHYQETQKVSQVSHNVNFQTPKNTAKKSNFDSNYKTITQNRFEVLSTGNENNEMDPKSFEIEIDDKNVTKRQIRKGGNQNKKPNKTIVAILGDSIVKDVKGWELSDNKKKVIVKSFSGATTHCMKSHIVPTKEQEPDVIVLHCGTNDLRKTEDVESIASNVIELVLSLKTESNSVIVSGLTPRNDKLREKAAELNILLKSETNSRNIGFVDHSNIDHRHLNRSNLHLNREGSTIFSKNLELAIKN